MCGIVAYSGVKPFNSDKINFLMYWNSVERGTDATGIFTPAVGVIKEAKSCDVFITKNNLRQYENNQFIGHVRSSTSGSAKDNKNAHPFEFDHIVGVHNGTLKNFWPKLREYGFNLNDFNVDSQVLYKLISIKGPEVISEIEGAMALVWYNKNDDIIYVYKNNERTLFRGKIDDAMYISSIKEPLEAVGCTQIKEFKDETLYSIKDGKIIKCSDKIKKFVPPVVVNPILERLKKYIGCFARFIPNKSVSFPNNNYLNSLSGHISIEGNIFSGYKNYIFDGADSVVIHVVDIIKHTYSNTSSDFFKVKIRLFINGVLVEPCFHISDTDLKDKMIICSSSVTTIYDRGILVDELSFKKRIIGNVGDTIIFTDMKDGVLEFYTESDENKSLFTLESFDSIIPCINNDDVEMVKNTFKDKLNTLNQPEEESSNDPLDNSDYLYVQISSIRELKTLLNNRINTSMRDLYDSNPEQWEDKVIELDSDITEIFENYINKSSKENQEELQALTTNSEENKVQEEEETIDYYQVGD